MGKGDKVEEKEEMNGSVCEERRRIPVGWRHTIPQRGLERREQMLHKDGVDSKNLPSMAPDLQRKASVPWTYLNN